MSTSGNEPSDESVLDRLRPRDVLSRGLGDPPSFPRTPPPAVATRSDSRRESLRSTAVSGVRSGVPWEASPDIVDQAMSEAVARLFPEYAIGGKLGGGGGGTVFRAMHRQLRRPVALKVLAQAHRSDVGAIARFEREIAVVGQMDDPRIVRAFDGGQREGVWYLVMELVEGIDFGALSKARGPLEVADACELVRQAALALQHAHECGLIHRDVKPSNLMLVCGPDGTPRVKVLDFGLAQLRTGTTAGGELTLSGDLLGTIDYVAPEQITNPRTVDVRADVYGLGATLFRLLTGRSPRDSAEAGTTLYEKLLRLSREAGPGIEVHRDGLPDGLAAVSNRMLSLHPDARFQTAAEVARALEPFSRGHRAAMLVGDPTDRKLPPGDVSTELREDRATPSAAGWPAIGWTVIAAGLCAIGLGWAGWFWFDRVTSADDPRLATLPPSVALASVSGLGVPRGITLGRDGAFYGGATSGGRHGHGAIYRFLPPAGIEPVVHFTGTSGTARGRLPGRQLLMARDGWIYGVTQAGGLQDRGTIFRFDPKHPGQEPVTLWDFEGPEGAGPLAGLVEDTTESGVFYGGTQSGGRHDAGTLFRLSAKPGGVQFGTLVHFSGDQGEAPGHRLVSGLAQVRDGTLFGSTPEGGRYGGGTLFKVTRDGRFTHLYAFGGAERELGNPTGGLTVGSDDQIYGHCRLGRGGVGAAFRVRPDGTPEILARFEGLNGSEPASTLFSGADGALFGTTLRGGESGRGTLFELHPDGRLKSLAAFVDVGRRETAAAWGMPVRGRDGHLYGTIESGGELGAGFLYRVSSSGRLSTLVQFGL